VVTFLFARAAHALDYRTFSNSLLAYAMPAIYVLPLMSYGVGVC